VVRHVGCLRSAQHASRPCHAGASSCFIASACAQPPLLRVLPFREADLPRRLYHVHRLIGRARQAEEWRASRSVYAGVHAVLARAL